MNRIKKIVGTSILYLAVAAALSVAYGLFALRAFTLRYVFFVSFFVGVVIIITGIIVLMTPTFMLIRNKYGNSKLIDHSTYSRVFHEERENKLTRAHDIIYVGISSILLTSIAQFILSFVY